MQALPFLSAAGKLVQGVGGFMAGNANASRMEDQAGEEQRAAAADARRVADERRSQIGELLAAQVSNGLEGGTGTALDALRQSQINAAMDVMEIRRQGAARSRALRIRADDARREGRFALVEGVLGAGSSYLKQRKDWAQEKALDARDYGGGSAGSHEGAHYG